MVKAFSPDGLFHLDFLHEDDCHGCLLRSQAKKENRKQQVKKFAAAAERPEGGCSQEQRRASI